MSLAQEIGGIIEETLLLLPMRELATKTQRRSYGEYRVRLERRWIAAIGLAHDDLDAQRILNVAGALMGFKNQSTGRTLTIDDTATSILSVLG